MREDGLIDEKSLQDMENLLSQAATGTHLLFDNIQLKSVLQVAKDDKEFFDQDTLKKVQEVMTELMSISRYHDKLDYLERLDDKTHEIVVRSYFHLVEHTAFSSNPVQH